MAGRVGDDRRAGCAIALTFGLKGSICEVGCLWFRLADLELGFLEILILLVLLALRHRG